MPCSHSFHEGCIFSWLAVSRLCPLCRFALPAEVDSDSDTGNDEDDEGEDADDGGTSESLRGLFCVDG
ncbi:hypothetical protein BAE44_0004008 [Dichanthelium oligosanthes]|uniref:RING-type domain-containing protein n=1 Tax=Dichanthelium oligosanthes TaxID=888268 RepID=A0A1E5WCC7_9POAL|nr:hypothetical protein BAE44_0004008 [Dichanthelium oligosanthes]